MTRRSYLKKRGGSLSYCRKQSNQMKRRDSIPCRGLPESNTLVKTAAVEAAKETETAASLHRKGEMIKV